MPATPPACAEPPPPAPPPKPASPPNRQQTQPNRSAKQPTHLEPRQLVQLLQRLRLGPLDHLQRQIYGYIIIGLKAKFLKP
jgi:hypothetical protein